jgi:hypothetical protein
MKTERVGASAGTERDCMPPDERSPPQHPYPAEKTRAGEIILRTPLRRVVFLAGLVGAVLLALLLTLLAR